MIWKIILDIGLVFDLLNLSCTWSIGVFIKIYYFDWLSIFIAMLLMLLGHINNKIIILVL